jgi:hypothetical protein
MLEGDDIVNAVLNNQEVFEDALAKEKPAEVLELEKILADLSNYRALLKQGMYPGNASKILVQFQDFITSTYNQVLAQYNETPYIKSLLARKKKQQEILDKLEAEEG